MPRYAQRVLILALLIALASSMILLRSTSGFTVVGSNAFLPPPHESLADAQSQSPFRIRIPAYLPAGAYLFNVTYTAPAKLGARKVFSVGLWYALRSGHRLHLWQSNMPMPALKDPTNFGGPVHLSDGTTWSEGILSRPDRALNLAHRFSDGVVISMDAPLDSETMHRIAASL